MFWGAIQSDGRKLLVKCPNKLNAVGYLEIFKIYEEKIHFLDTIFQQDNAPVHKLKFIGNFFPRKWMECTRKASIQFRSESYGKFMGDFWSNDYGNTFLWEKLDEKCMKFGIKLTQKSCETCMKTIQTVY